MSARSTHKTFQAVAWLFVLAAWNDFNQKITSINYVEVYYRTSGEMLQYGQQEPPTLADYGQALENRWATVMQQIAVHRSKSNGSLCKVSWHTEKSA